MNRYFPTLKVLFNNHFCPCASEYFLAHYFFERLFRFIQIMNNDNPFSQCQTACFYNKREFFGNLPRSGISWCNKNIPYRWGLFEFPNESMLSSSASYDQDFHLYIISLTATENSLPPCDFMIFVVICSLLLS